MKAKKAVETFRVPPRQCPDLEETNRRYPHLLVEHGNDTMENEKL
jgi:hypothetical protein